MNRALLPEEINWLRMMRDAKPETNPAPNIPARVALKLRFLGLVAPNKQGEWEITARGREELRERGHNVVPLLRIVRPVRSRAQHSRP